MDVLWSAAGPMSAKEILVALPRDDLATTTVLTVLSRLERKEFVVRHRDGRAHTYEAAGTREEHIAGVMREVLGLAADPDAALVRFAGAVSPQEADVLRRALRRRDR